MKLLAISLAVIATAVVAAPAFGGWVQVDREGTTTLISEGMLKETSTSDDQYSILDVKKGEILFIDTRRKVYSRDRIDDFCAVIIAEVRKARSDAAVEEKKQKKHGKDAPKVSVTKEGDGGLVAGYPTVKYRVTADDKLYEEVWITSDPAVMKDLESVYRTVMKKFEKCLASIATASPSLQLAVEETPEYKKMEHAGWQMRSRSSTGGGEPVTYELIRLEKKDIPLSEFAVPAGYRKVPVAEILYGER